MRGTVAKRLRKQSGFKPGTTVKYLVHKDTGMVICGRPRRTYQHMKKSFKVLGA
jgi:hypothetical protein